VVTRTAPLWIGLLAALLAGCSGGSSQDESSAVEAGFDSYRQAILDQDGTAAVACVDAKTLEYYGEMLDLALRGSRVKVMALSVLDKMMVISIRHRVPRAVLEGMTPESLFVHAVDEGWIDRASVETLELGEIVVSAGTARVVFLTEGKTIPGARLVFRQEEERWKIDLTSIMPLASLAFEGAIRQSGISEEEFLTSVLEEASGVEVGESVWEPISR